MLSRKLIVKAGMATGGGPFEEGMNDQDLPNWSNEGVDDRLNNMVWYFIIDGVLLTTTIKMQLSPDLAKLNSLKLFVNTVFLAGQGIKGPWAVTLVEDIFVCR